MLLKAIESCCEEASAFGSMSAQSNETKSEMQVKSRARPVKPSNPQQFFLSKHGRKGEAKNDSD